MHPISTDNFGPLIAYLLPGFVVLWGVRLFSPTIEFLLSVSSFAAPTVGGFLYITLAAMTAGLIVSAVRWALVDTLFHNTGITQPKLRFSGLPHRVEAFLAVVEANYRFYQFHSNLLIAVTFTYAVRLYTSGIWPPGWFDVGFALVWLVLFLASRDSLKRYYSRAAEILAASPTVPDDSHNMRPIAANNTPQMRKGSYYQRN